MSQEEDGVLQLQCHPPEYNFEEEDQVSSKEENLNKLSGPLEQRTITFEKEVSYDDEDGLIPQQTYGYFGPEIRLKPMQEIECVHIPFHRLDYLRTPALPFRVVPPLTKANIITFLTDRYESKLMLRHGQIYGQRRHYLDVALPPFPANVDKTFEETCRRYGFFCLDTEGQPKIAALQLGAPTGEVLVFPNFKPEQLSEGLKNLIADRTIAKIQSGIDNDSGVLAKCGIILRGGVDARCIWKAWIPREPMDPDLNKTGIDWLSSWLGPNFPRVKYEHKHMTFKMMALPEDEFQHAVQDVRYPLAGLYKTALQSCDSDGKTLLEKDNVLPSVFKILLCHQNNFSNPDFMVQVMQGQTIGFIPNSGFSSIGANSALTVYKMIDSSRQVILVRDYWLPSSLRPHGDDDLISENRLAERAYKFWEGRMLPKKRSIDSFSRGFAIRFCEACGGWDHLQHKVDFCQQGLTFDPCTYPLCQDKDKHALQVCPFLGGLCDHCHRRGHSQSDHNDHHPLDLDYIFLWWAPCHMVTSLPFLELTDRDIFCDDYIWRASLYSQNRNLSQRLLAAYDMPFRALPPRSKKLSQYTELEGHQDIQICESRRKADQISPKAAAAAAARKLQKKRTDPSKTYKRFLEQEIPAPSEHPLPPPMELQALPAPPTPSSSGKNKHGPSPNKRSVKDRLGAAGSATTQQPNVWDRLGVMSEPAVQEDPQKKSVKSRLGASRRETVNPQ